MFSTGKTGKKQVRQKKVIFIRIIESLFSRQVAHPAGAYPSFLSMKRLGVLVLPPGLDASPSQVNPPPPA